MILPTGTSMMVRGLNKKRREQGAWGRLRKRSLESSSSCWDQKTSSDPSMRIIRGGGKDLNRWERVLKRRADDEARMWAIKKSKVLRALSSSASLENSSSCFSASSEHSSLFCSNSSASSFSSSSLASPASFFLILPHLTRLSYAALLLSRP